METKPQDKKVEPETHIRLLLHAVDGLVPYLTPQLLRTCFPVETTGDRLWMGMAIKDTCVTPTFHSADDAAKNHPRGYVFDAQQQQPVDAWMLPYPRVTVPTFDMIADAASRQQSKDAAATVATDHHVMLWTGNGRTPATPAQYAACAQQLASRYAVPLFDDAGAAATGPIKKKRWLAAQKRSQAWCLDFVERTATGGFLFPILLQQESNEDGIEEQLQFLLDNTAISKSKDMGLVLIGWSYLSEALQKASLEQAKARLPEAPLGMLATQSFAQVLLAACHGATIIGSNLPQQWALQKKAFLLDLDNCWNDMAEPPAKRSKIDDESATILLDENACLDLQPPPDRVQDHPWYRDKRPLLAQCTCHTCQIHCRAYIYHLVCAKEMLAEILLFIHNLHHLLEVLQSVEKAGSEKRAALLANTKSLSKVDTTSTIGET